MANNLLSDKMVVIIGGAGLLGQAFVHAILQQGGTVIVADIDPSRAESVCRDCNLRFPGSTSHPESVDINTKDSIDRLISRVSARFGKIDAVINSAYPRNKQYGRKLEDVEYADFCDNVGKHLGGYFLSTQRFAEFFKRQTFGHVINISSIYGSIAPRFEVYEGTAMTMPVEYAAIKSAVQHLSIYFMRYYKGTPLRFNCISPGGILDNQPTSFVQRYNVHAQFKGMLHPSDIAGTAVFLLSDLSTHINGQNLIVDDGWST